MTRTKSFAPTLPGGRQAARGGDWKLIRFYETGREEFYSLKSDVQKENEPAAANADQRKELSARRDAWLKEAGAQMPVSKP